MDVTHTTIPGVGTVHHCDTRQGDHLAVIVNGTGRRTLLFYDRADPDAPAHTVELEQREADQLAGLLHSRPIADRLAAVERRLATLLHDAHR